MKGLFQPAWLTGALICLSLGPALSCSTAPAHPDQDPGIRPWVENPRFWQFKGEPVLLLGGTDTDAMFQWDAERLTSHLDLLVSAGGNYIRNVMSSRNPLERGDVQPFRLLEDGRYDLDQWNPEYWTRFERMLAETARRDVIVQIELWDGHDFQSRVDNEAGFPQWDVHPFNPRNNSNYTAADTSLPETWTIGYPNETHPILLTVPDLNDDPAVLRHQERFIGAVLERAMAYAHVLYVIQNESWVDQAWSNYWAAFARQEAAERGRRVYVADMQFDPGVAPVLHHGFDFAELSQSASGAGRPPGVHVGQGHFDHIAAQWTLLTARPAPINSVKQYGGDVVDWSMGSDEGVERVWRSIFAGQAGVRFHRPPTGIGLSDRAQANIRSLRMLAELIDIFHVQPHQNVQGLLSGRLENEAYVMADPGRAYAIFFTAGGGEASLDASASNDEVLVRWLDPNRAEWALEQTFSAGRIALSAPGSSQWMALVVPK